MIFTKKLLPIEITCRETLVLIMLRPIEIKKTQHQIMTKKMVISMKTNLFDCSIQLSRLLARSKTLDTFF